MMAPPASPARAAGGSTQAEQRPTRQGKAHGARDSSPPAKHAGAGAETRGEVRYTQHDHSKRRSAAAGQWGKIAGRHDPSSTQKDGFGTIWYCGGGGAGGVRSQSRGESHRGPWQRSGICWKGRRGRRRTLKLPLRQAGQGSRGALQVPFYTHKLN